VDDIAHVLFETCERHFLCEFRKVGFGRSMARHVTLPTRRNAIPRSDFSNVIQRSPVYLQLSRLDVTKKIKIYNRSTGFLALAGSSNCQKPNSHANHSWKSCGAGRHLYQAHKDICPPNCKRDGKFAKKIQHSTPNLQLPKLRK
jgi:hypothetical protein